MKRAAESKPKSIVRENVPAQDDPCKCELPYGDHADLIALRVDQLRALCGMAISLGSKTDKQEVGLLPADLGAVASLADELLEEIEEHADTLEEHLTQAIQGQASRPVGEARTQPSSAVA